MKKKPKKLGEIIVAILTIILLLALTMCGDTAPYGPY